MLPTRNGAFRLFQFSGIEVFLHWSWFLVAAYEISTRGEQYSSPIWNVLEYLSLFLIVLMHEFGHSLACRSVGGKADQIVLWPLGGVAYVAPPPRPGPTLWSIAAGPLVNVVLFPILSGALFFSKQYGLAVSMPNFAEWLHAVWFMNVALLIFNLMPVYPLDGGQILRSLLWFPLGRARSLMVATVIGFVSVAGLVAFAFFSRSVWITVMAVFIFMNCWRSLMEARVLSRLAKLPRRAGFACPACHSSPPSGPLWLCSQCQHRFDTFESRANCPNCGTQYPQTLCFDCGNVYPMHEWISSGSVPPKL